MKKAPVFKCDLQHKWSVGWGKPVGHHLLGDEKTAEDVIRRLVKLNPGSEWRIVEGENR
jgi:hypothetical protein